MREKIDRIKEKLLINEDKLDDEIREQPALFYYYAEQGAQASREEDLLKLKMEVTYAE